MESKFSKGGKVSKGGLLIVCKTTKGIASLSMRARATSKSCFSSGLRCRFDGLVGVCLWSQIGGDLW